MTSSGSNARQAKILMAASRIKRQIDRAKISCPPLSALASPKPEEISELKALLNQCMSIGGELGEEAENLWDLLELTDASTSQASSASPSPIGSAQVDLAKQADAALAAKRKADLDAKKKSEDAAKAQKDAPKKGGLFGWLAPEKPDDSKGDDDDKDDDGHYTCGLR